MPRALAKTVDGVRRAMRRLGRAVLTTCGRCCGCTSWYRYAPCGTASDGICGQLPDAVYVCTSARCADGPLNGRGFLRGGYCWTRVDETVYTQVTPEISIDPAEVLVCITGCSDPRCPSEPMAIPGRSCRPNAHPVWLCANAITKCVYARYGGVCYGFYPTDARPVSSIPSGATILPALTGPTWDGCCGCDPDCIGELLAQTLFDALPFFTKPCCCGDLEGARATTRVTDRANYTDPNGATYTTGVDITGTVTITNGQPVTTGTRRDFDSRTPPGQTRPLLSGEIAAPACGISPTLAQLGGTFFPPGSPNVTVVAFDWTCLVFRLVLRYAPPHVPGQTDIVQTTEIVISQNTLGDAPPCTKSCGELPRGFDAP